MKRDLQNKMIFGVCAGIANELNIDPLIVRVVFIVATLLGIGFPIIFYLVMALLMPAN